MRTLYAMGSVYIARKDSLFTNIEFEPLISMLAVRQAAFRLGMRKRSSWRTTVFGSMSVGIGAWLLYQGQTANGLGFLTAGLGLLVGADASVLNRMFNKPDKKDPEP